MGTARFRFLWVVGAILSGGALEAQDAVTVKSTDGVTDRLRLAVTQSSGATPATIRIEKARLQFVKTAGLEGFLNVDSAEAASPVAGDLRYDGANILFRDATSWKTLATTGSSSAGYVLLAPAGAQTDSSVNATLFINDTGGGNLLNLQSGGTSRLVVTNGGSVGIGNASPTRKLEVAGDMVLNDHLYTNADTGQKFVFGGTGVNGPFVELYGRDHAFWKGNAYLNFDGVDAAGQELGILKRTSGGGASYLLNILDNGNVGIGTSSPVTDALLEVAGGDTKGLRLQPRSVSGAPTSGAWSKGTLIVDSAGVLFICTAGGTPGTWAKVGAQ